MSRLDVGNSLDWRGRLLGGSCSNNRSSVCLALNSSISQMLDATSLVFTLSRDGKVVDWGLELDKRVSLVVEGTWKSLAHGAEIGVMTDNTLVAHALDVSLVGLIVAERAVTVDTMVTNRRRTPHGDRVVEGSKAVTRVLVTSTLDALTAKIIVGAGEALVANAKDCLVASVANGVVASVATSRQKSLFGQAKLGARDCSFEMVARVVTVLVCSVATTTKVKVVADIASDKLVFRKADDTRVASAESTLELFVQSLCVFREGTRALAMSLDVVGLNRLLLHLGSNALSSTGDDLAVGNSTLDQPVTLARTKLPTLNTLCAKVVVAAVADAAVEVDVIHAAVALVAVDGPG